MIMLEKFKRRDDELIHVGRHYARRMKQLLTCRVTFLLYTTLALGLAITFITLPGSSVRVHGLKKKPEPSYELVKFSPTFYRGVDRLNATGNSTKSCIQSNDTLGSNCSRPWLVVVNTTPADLQRRMIMRATWQSLYRDVVPMDTRFFMANPGERWARSVAFENETYGDLVVLNDLIEDGFTGNTIKTVELWKWLLVNSRPYELVTKVDYDTFVNAKGLWDRYIAPLLEPDFPERGVLRSRVRHTMVGLPAWSSEMQVHFCHGMLYTLTWDLLQRSVALQESSPITIHEDVLTPALMNQAGEHMEIIAMSLTEAFNYLELDARGDGTAWARSGSHYTEWFYHALTPETLAVHDLKTDAIYLRIAAHFDKEGLKIMDSPLAPEVRSLWLTAIDWAETLNLNWLYRSRRGPLELIGQNRQRQISIGS
jgi:hypothetical protein